MQSILDLGIQLILAIQNIGDWLVMPMKFFSFLGTEEFFLIVAPVIYWVFDSTLGLKLGMYLMICASVNAVLKIFMHAPRPYWIDTRVKALSVESSFGIPSGHAMNSTAIWGTLAAKLKTTATWIVSIILILLIGLSRLALGMHFPTDVLAGWFLSIVLLFILFGYENKIEVWLKNKTASQIIGLAFLLSVVLIGLGVIARLSLASWIIPETWLQNAELATGISGSIDPLNLSGLISSSGALFGLAAGYVIFGIYGGFQTRGTANQKTLRFIVGVVGILIIWKGLGMFLPGGTSGVALIFRYIRYTLIGAWVTGGAPWVFTHYGLADKK